jgi:hypothetical protein
MPLLSVHGLSSQDHGTDFNVRLEEKGCLRS